MNSFKFKIKSIGLALFVITFLFTSNAKTLDKFDRADRVSDYFAGILSFNENEYTEMLSISEEDIIREALPLSFFLSVFLKNLYFPFLNCISFGISTKTGPGLPVVATSKAKCKTLERSFTSFTNQLCFVHGRVIPVVSHS